MQEWNANILQQKQLLCSTYCLMEEILHQLIWLISHIYIWGFILLSVVVSRISSINSMRTVVNLCQGMIFARFTTAGLRHGWLKSVPWGFSNGAAGFSPRFKVVFPPKIHTEIQGSGLWVSNVLLESRKTCETRAGHSWKGTQTKSTAFPWDLLAVRFSVRVVRNLPKDELRNWSNWTMVIGMQSV